MTMSMPVSLDGWEAIADFACLLFALMGVSSLLQWLCADPDAEHDEHDEDFWS